MLESLQVETAPNPTWSIIWLHGLGADGHDFEPIVPDLIDARKTKTIWPAIRFVFPHAPVMPVTINGGMRMRAWYDILGSELMNRADEVGVRRSVEQIRALITSELARGIVSERIILAGFSQGGAIVLATALRHELKLGGIVALSTYLPLADKTATELSPANRSIPIFWGHGTLDPVIGIPLAVMSREMLKAQGYELSFHTYPMPHSVCAEEINDLRDWLDARFKG